MKKFPWDCNDCPMLHTYDMSIDDLTHICLWSKTQIDDCDRYESAECPMEKHDKQIRTDAIDEYKGKMLSRLIPHLNDLECAKDSETYLAITEIAEQLKENK